MTAISGWVEKRRMLRTEADRVVGTIYSPNFTAQPADVMLHELLVHKVELEMQVEELQRTHAALEEARDRYGECCEYSPVGMLTINRDGLITESNLKGAALFGVERATLLERHLEGLVSPQDSDRWHRIFRDIMDPVDLAERAYVLKLVCADGATFDAYLSCRRHEPVGGPAVLRLTLFDIDQIRQATAE